MLITLAAALCVLAGCENKITKANFDKITQGMSQREVERLLGTKGFDETAPSINVGSTGIDTKNSNQQVIRYSGKDGAIVVTYRDGKVFEATPVGL
jgi:hypothetical protein